MKRIDSGFQESILFNTPHDGPSPVVRSNTAPTGTRRRQARKDLNSPYCHTNMESQRPESEKRSRPAHQRSKTSSSETSTTRSRGHGHGSKPSSRRTSCTIVDPSRSRHYRIQSSNTVPIATSQDIDDVYALHHRSYNLFQNPSIHTRSELPSPSSQTNYFDMSNTCQRLSVDERQDDQNHCLPKQSEESTSTTERTSTTTHWTSPGTRRREYDRIDRANSGLRGFVNKVMPRCVSGPQEKFYEKDQSDAGSVRRYRIEDEDSTTLEKLSHTYTPRKPSTPKKKWNCF
ncbi:hypothetical protein GQ44DRAFT_80450 [Phaeosphaeriaceae sp. PMI808]|nr:hypothetical protein GQ44DRAFT_80450 [Phaeosphaeriaceae sp. PMI808]